MTKPTAAPVRDRTLLIHLSAEEHEQLKALAQADDVHMSQTIRRWLRNAWLAHSRKAAKR